MKQILSILVLTAFIALVTSDHASWGSRLPGDRLLDTKIYEKSGKTLQVRKMDVQYNGYYNITMINVIDRKKADKPTLLSGGPGTKTAGIRLKSLRGKGFQFQLEIFGR